MRALAYVVSLTLLATAVVVATQGEETVPEGVADGEVPVVVTTAGKVSGIKEVSTKGKNFYSYYSIPYAQPPTGELRFKDPVMVEPWEGVKEGTTMPPVCSQISLFALLLGVGELEVEGQEDCLFLNIFTPKPREEKPLLPVMVFIHGGAWISGGAREYPPHVLMNHDVVLVTIQYRLGLLGFMSTEDEVAPGNFGLKDQTLALTWIQKNIHNFGGDTIRTTIFGESAGAASVHFQILTYNSIGLFNRAILQSGSALCPWALVTNHNDVAQYTGHLFNCSQPDDDPLPSQGLIDCLQGVDAKEFAPVPLHFKQWMFVPLMVGPRVDGDYLKADPATLMKESRHKRLDLISGITKDEGAFITRPMYGNEAHRSSLKYNFINTAPHALGFSPEDIAPLNQTIKIFDHYLGGVHLDVRHSDNVTTMFTDRYFAVSHDLTTSMYAKNVARFKKKVYQFELSHRGQHSFGDEFDLTVGDHWVSHIDELQYLFTGGPLFKPLEREEDLKLRDIMTTMWTNFATTGNPTPDDSLGFTWEPVRKDQLRHLALQPQPAMVDDYRNQTRDFWMSLPLKVNLVLRPERVTNLEYATEEVAEEEAGAEVEPEVEPEVEAEVEETTAEAEEEIEILAEEEIGEEKGGKKTKEEKKKTKEEKKKGKDKTGEKQENKEAKKQKDKKAKKPKEGKEGKGKDTQHKEDKKQKGKESKDKAKEEKTKNKDKKTKEDKKQKHDGKGKKDKKEKSSKDEL